MNFEDAKSLKIAPLPHENHIFEVPGVPLDRLYRVEIVIKFDVMLDHVSEHVFNRFLIDLGSNLGRHMGPKTGPSRLR